MKGIAKWRNAIDLVRRFFPPFLALCLVGAFIAMKYARNHQALIAILLLTSVVFIIGIIFMTIQKTIEYKNGIVVFVKCIRTLIDVDKGNYSSTKIDTLKKLLENKAEIRDRDAFEHNAGRLFDEQQEIKAAVQKIARENIQYVILATFIVFGVYMAMISLLSMPPLHKIPTKWLVHLYWMGALAIFLPSGVLMNLQILHMPIDASSKLYVKRRKEFIESMNKELFEGGGK